jgi:hypothetical protein
MPTDKLLDDPAMDHAIRELLTPGLRSPERELAQRDALMAHITGHRVEGAPLRLDITRSAHVERRRRRRALVGAAASVAAVVGVLVFAAQRDTPAAPGAQPVVTTPATVAPDELIVPAERPDVYPALPLGDPRAGTATASYGGQIAWNNPASASAFVARDDGTTLSGGISLSVIVGFTGDDLGYTAAPEPISVAGLALELYTAGAVPGQRTLVLSGDPAVTVSGVDPVAFVGAAGGIPVVDATTGADGEVSFALTDLPPGYVVVTPPERLPRGAINAYLEPDTEIAVGPSLYVDVYDQRSVFGMNADLTVVDINGRTGWTNGSMVIWPVSDGTWARADGNTTLDAALELARSVEFVDEATWRDRYRVGEPQYPSRDQQGSAGSEDEVPASTVAESVPTDLVTGRTSGLDGDAVAPVDCGSIAPSAHTVASPLPMATPTAALTSWLGTEPADPYFDTGFTEVDLLDSTGYRYEQYVHELLALVVHVDRIGTDWAVTRWEASAC